MEKVDRMKASQIEWSEHEAAERGWFAYSQGVTGEVLPEQDGGWFWMVRPTGEVSEYPELYDSGIVPKRPSVAKMKAAASMIRAMRSYGPPRKEW